MKHLDAFAGLLSLVGMGLFSLIPAMVWPAISGLLVVAAGLALNAASDLRDREVGE